MRRTIQVDADSMATPPGDFQILHLLRKTLPYHDQAGDVITITGVILEREPHSRGGLIVKALGDVFLDSTLAIGSNERAMLADFHDLDIVNRTHIAKVGQ